VWYFGGEDQHQIQRFAWVSGPLSDWSAVDLADLNGDGVPDVILRHTDGSLGVWFLGGVQGHTIQGFAYISGPLQGWVPVAVADLDGDGHSDLILQATDGSIGVWYLGGPQGIQILRFDWISGPLRGWVAVAANDLDHDGHPDLILQATDGSIGVWYLNGNHILGFAGIYGPTGGWSVVGVAQFNVAVNSEIILRYTDGSLGVWYMFGSKGNLPFAFAFISGPLTDWRGLTAH